MPANQARTVVMVLCLKQSYDYMTAGQNLREFQINAYISEHVSIVCRRVSVTSQKLRHKHCTTCKKNTHTMTYDVQTRHENGLYSATRSTTVQQY